MELQRHSDRPPFLTADDGFLRLTPYDDWCDYERKIVARSEVDPTARDYVRRMLSYAESTPIDKQGRILVPQYLRDEADLGREVTIAGVGPTVEIWDTQRFQTHLEKTQENFRTISEEMAQKLRS
jgi:MraZ protein